jgi:hypothetical protein
LIRVPTLGCHVTDPFCPRTLQGFFIIRIV